MYNVYNTISKYTLGVYGEVPVFYKLFRVIGTYGF